MRERPREGEERGDAAGVVVGAGRAVDAVVVRADDDDLVARAAHFRDDVAGVARCRAAGLGERALDEVRGARVRFRMALVALECEELDVAPQRVAQGRNADHGGSATV